MKSKVILYLSFIILIIGFSYFIYGLVNLFQQQNVPPEGFTVNLPDENTNPAPTVFVKASESAKVVRVIDGDTIEVDLNGEKKKIRYIGIDTPETVDPRRAVACFGKEASNENKKLVENEVVSLEKDISETDQFGRLLRYVYVLKDDQNIFVNDYLVRQGFAKVSTFPPDVRFADQFLEAQNEATVNKRGLWQKCQ